MTFKVLRVEQVLIRQGAGGGGLSEGPEELKDSSEHWLHSAGVAERRYPTSKVRSGGPEEICHVQGQRNPSKTVDAGATVRRYPVSKDKGEAPARWEQGRIHV